VTRQSNGKRRVGAEFGGSEGGVPPFLDLAKPADAMERLDVESAKE
jgi:hypothetical protein